MADTVTVCFFRSDEPVDLAVRDITRRPDQPFADVPSHCAIALPCVCPCGSYTVYEMVAQGWVKRPAIFTDFTWSYEVPLPDMDACRAWCEQNSGRYRWWVDGLIGLMALRLIRHRRVSGLLKRWHLAVRHICSVDTLRALTEGGWPCPLWLSEQECPASPNDVLYAVRRTLGLAQGK